MNLCKKCKHALGISCPGQGACIVLCADCSIITAANYINNKWRLNMEPLSKKSDLNRQISSIVEGTEQSFPFTFTYCEGLGKPLFTFTVEKKTEDHFIDKHGQKWIRASE